MTPFSAVYDAVNGRLEYAELLADLRATLPLFVKAAHFSDLISRKLGVSILFALSVSTAALRFAVLRVIPFRAKPKVRGIAAGAIVARMAHTHAVRDGAIVQDVAKAMGVYRLIAGKVERTIAYCLGVAAPFPTVIGAALVYLFPKLRYDLWRKRGILCHVNSLLSTLAAPPDDPTRRGGNFVRGLNYTTSGA